MVKNIDILDYMLKPDSLTYNPKQDMSYKNYDFVRFPNTLHIKTSYNSNILHGFGDEHLDQMCDFILKLQRYIPNGYRIIMSPYVFSYKTFYDNYTSKGHYLLPMNIGIYPSTKVYYNIARFPLHYLFIAYNTNTQQYILTNDYLAPQDEKTLDFQLLADILYINQFYYKLSSIKQKTFDTTENISSLISYILTGYNKIMLYDEYFTGIARIDNDGFIQN